MKVYPLSFNETVGLGGFNYVAEVVWSDLTTANAVHTHVLLPVRAGDAIIRVGYKLVTGFDFSDASINSLTMQIGDSSDTDRFLTAAATQLAEDGTEVEAVVAPGSITTFPYAYLANGTVDATFTAAGGASPLANEATVGEVHIFFQIAHLNRVTKRIN